MTWDDVLDRMKVAGLNPVEETYMEHYGKLLSAQSPQFQGRIIRCTYGRVHCGDVALEILLFPSETHVQDFVELLEDDPWWMIRDNAAIHFPVCDPGVVDRVLNSLSRPML